MGSESCHSLTPLVGALMGGIAVVLAGCGAKEELPPPGAQSQVVVHWWDERGSAPAYLQAERVAQDGTKFEKLVFSDVLMRVPNEVGVVYIAAPEARYERDAAEEIVLSAAEDRPIDGPVRFLGAWAGDVFIGRAERAVFEEGKHRMRLDQVEIVFKGLRQKTAYAAITEDKVIPIGKLERLRSAPALTAAMAALPVPLILPPIRQK